MRAYRAWTRFGDAKGNLLAAGVAYFGFFSLFPAVALAAVVFGFLLAGNPELLDAVGRSLDEALPGLVKTAANPDGLMPLAAPETATLSWAGVVAFGSLVLGGLGWIGSLRDGIRTVFGVRGTDGNPVLAKLRDLLVLGLLGASLLVSAVSSSVVAAASTWVSDLLGLGRIPSRRLLGRLGNGLLRRLPGIVRRHGLRHDGLLHGRRRHAGLPWGIAIRHLRGLPMRRLSLGLNLGPEKRGLLWREAKGMRQV